MNQTIFSLAIRYESEKPDEMWVSLWPSRQTALDAVRDDFSETLDCADEFSSADVSTDEGMLSYLASCGTYVAIDEQIYRAPQPINRQIQTSAMWIVYESETGELFYQPYTDLVEAGTLIEPETGDDMPILGWATALPE